MQKAYDMSSKLQEYETPANVIDGVWITTENGLKVRVTLPAAWNLKYQYALAKAMTTPVDEDGNEVDTGNEGRLQNYHAMLKGFSESCILEIKNETVKLPLPFEKYFKLIKEVFELAAELAEKETAALDKTVKK